MRYTYHNMFKIQSSTNSLHYYPQYSFHDSFSKIVHSKSFLMGRIFIFVCCVSLFFVSGKTGNNILLDILLWSFYNVKILFSLINCLYDWLT